MKTTELLTLELAALLVLSALPVAAAEASLESAPPVVVKTIPPAGDDQVDPGLREIRVTYSKAMQDGSWSWSRLDEQSFPETTGQPHYLADGRTCVLPVKLQPRKSYAIWLNSERFKNFQDTTGLPAVPYLLTFSTGDPTQAPTSDAYVSLLNADQRLILDWTDQQFRSFFDERTFDGWTEARKTELESGLMDLLKGPQTREYYQAINTLAALHSTRALPTLREIAFSRADRNNRDRWMAIRALGIVGDKSAVPELIHLVYHGNLNTHWWAQISLVRLTGQNFGGDWKAWGNWWNEQKGQPPFNPEIIRWWSGQPEPDKLAASLDEADRKFFARLRPEPESSASPAATDPAARLRETLPLLEPIRKTWAALFTEMDRGNTTNALAVLQKLTPQVQAYADQIKGTPLETSVRTAIEQFKVLASTLEKGDLENARGMMMSLGEQGQRIEEQMKTILEATADAFAGCRLVSFGGDLSGGKQSYGDRGPAIQFKPAAFLADIRPGAAATLRGVRLYASRYGAGYAPEATMLRVQVLDAQTNLVGHAEFAYAIFDYEEHWVNLVFAQPVTIPHPDEAVTIAFDPEATRTKGIYFHYQRDPAVSHSLAGKVGAGFEPLPQREWMVRAAFDQKPH